MFTHHKTDIERVFKENYSPLYIFAFQLIQDTEASRDIVGDAFEYLWRNHERMQPDTIKSYLYIYVRTKCIDYLRHAQVHEQYVEFCLATSSEDTEQDTYEPSERIQLLRHALQTLTPRTKHILEECYIRKKKYQEVADELEISPSAVQKHISKALKAIREAFAKKE